MLVKKGHPKVQVPTIGSKASRGKGRSGRTKSSSCIEAGVGGREMRSSSFRSRGEVLRRRGQDIRGNREVWEGGSRGQE